MRPPVAGVITGRGAQGVSISVTPLRRLTASEQRGVTAAALRYERFLGIPVAVTMG